MKRLAITLTYAALLFTSAAQAQDTNLDLGGKTYVFTLHAGQADATQDYHFWVRFFEGDSRMVEIDDDAFSQSTPRCHVHSAAQPCVDTRSVYIVDGQTLSLFSSRNGWPRSTQLVISDDGKTITTPNDPQIVYTLIE